MAAARETLAQGPEIVDLRLVSGRQLEPLLLEEAVEWDRELDWDFRQSAELVRQYADARGLAGVAMLSHGEVVGYSYSVLEDHKGLVGDLYLRPPWRAAEAEARLLRLMLETLARVPQVRRIESQLMLIGMEAGQTLREWGTARVHERVLMSLDLMERDPEWRGLPDTRTNLSGKSAVPVPSEFHIEPWGDHQHHAAAEVITQAYRGHVDSDINDQYRSQPGAHRFLYNIVQYPGCGSFFRPASHMAFDRATGSPAGVVLSSLVGSETGHITQLCIKPDAQGYGLGRALLGRSLDSLRARGLKRVTLTVTRENTSAVRLYERCGFREARRFFACVWEGSAP